MSEWITGAGTWTLHNSIGGAVLIGFVAVVAVFGRRWLRPRMQSFIWGLVALRFVLPVAPESGISIFNFFPKGGAENLSLAPANIPAAAALPEDTTISPTGIGRKIVFEAAEPFNLTALLMGVWIFGVIAVFGVVLAQQVVAVLRLRRMPTISDRRLLEIYGDCLNRAGMGELGVRLRLVESPQAGEIAVFGLLRARRIVVPSDIAERYSGLEIRGILFHELAHVGRCDLLRNWVTLTVQALHWFNPLVWWAGSRLRASRELICDQIALRHLDESGRRRYGLALLKTLEAGVPAPRMPFLRSIFLSKI